jgi:membrane protein
MFQFWQFWQTSRRGVVRLNEASHGWLGVLANAINSILLPEAYLTAAAVAYFAFFSLFPLTLLTVAIASIWFDPILAESEVVTHLEFIAPALGELLGANIAQIVMTRRSVTGLALLALLWSSSTIFHVLTGALDQIWKVDKRRPVWRHRGLALLTALVVSGLLLLASFVGSTVLATINALMPDQLQQFDRHMGLFSSSLMSILLFAVLYYFLPHTRLTWRDVLPGAIFAGLLWEAAKQAFLYFVSNYLSMSNLVYGSVTAITAFLTWSYFSSLIFFFGAYFNVGCSCLLKRRRAEANLG